MYPAPTFQIWRIVVDLRHREQCGRPLADADVTERELLIWWGYGVPARIVGNALAWKTSRVARVTFARFYTDRGAARVAARIVHHRGEHYG